MVNLSCQSVDSALWSIKERLFRICGSVNEANAAIDPLSWYIGTNRASLDFLYALINCTPLQFTTIARRLSKHCRGDYRMIINSISSYICKPKKQ